MPQADVRVMTIPQFHEVFNAQGEATSLAWPGLYPVYYLCEDGGVLCPPCVTKMKVEIESAMTLEDDPQWRVVATEVNWEDPALTCAHCGKRIESAYAEDNVQLAS